MSRSTWIVGSLETLASPTGSYQDTCWRCPSLQGLEHSSEKGLRAASISGRRPDTVLPPSLFCKLVTPLHISKESSQRQ